MIAGYRDRDTERFAAGERVRQWETFRQQGEKRLRILDAAASLNDLTALRSNRLEILHGDRNGEYSISDELGESGLAAKGLADLIGVPPNRLYQILAGKRSVTADTALRLGKYFGMSPEFWMNLQSAYDLDLARQYSGKEIARIRTRQHAA